MFELVYEPFEVSGTQVSEVKRITLDAGSNLDHFQSTYKPQTPGPLVTGIGLKKTAGQTQNFSVERGWLAAWERMEKNAGNQGLAVIVDPKLIEKRTEDQRNLLVLAKVPADNVASYWAGFCWDKGGQFTDYQAWKAYVDQFSQGLASAIEVTVAGQ
jgi:pectinesterase